VAEPLPEYRLKARNTSATSENLIHDERTARRYGFPGALVPGVTIYAYLTHPLVEALGPGWLDRGAATVRFTRPVLDGEDAVVTGEIVERTERGLQASVRITTPSGECATLTAGLPAGLPVAVNVAMYRVAPLPEERPTATRAHFASLEALGTPITTYDETCADAYVEKVADSLPVYRGPRGRVHPGFYLHEANRALSRNVTMSPWIHVGSVVRHLGRASIGDTLATRGRVRSLYERKGREYVEADLVVMAGERRPIAHILHTAIYRLPPPD
jgi:acyl dehydratase